MHKPIRRHNIIFYDSPEPTFDSILEESKHHLRTQLYTLTSGGKDSLTVCDMLSERNELKKVLHIDTGVGLSQVQEFLKDFCQSRGWELEIIRPGVPHIYASIVFKYGFPTPGMHGIVMAHLKYMAMKKFAKDNKLAEHGSYVTGIRKFESHRRHSKYPLPIMKEGGMWFISPCFHMTNEDVYKEYIARGLKRSPAYDNGLNTSGECMCGCFARPGELDIIKKMDPDLYDYFEYLREGILKYGTDYAKKHAVWGGGQDDPNVIQEISSNMNGSKLESMEAVSCGSECGPGTLRGDTDF